MVDGASFLLGAGVAFTAVYAGEWIYTMRLRRRIARARRVRRELAAALDALCDSRTVTERVR